jgi:hypothetical protein
MACLSSKKQNKFGGNKNEKPRRTKFAGAFLITAIASGSDGLKKRVWYRNSSIHAW